jgi:hypothetical protein
MWREDIPYINLPKPNNILPGVFIVFSEQSDTNLGYGELQKEIVMW